MSNYVKLLEEMGIDPEKALDLLEKRLSETNGSIHSFNAIGNVRCLRLERGKKLLNYAEGFNFQNGLKNLTKDIKNGGKQDKRKRHYSGQSNAKSTFDEWLLLGNTIDIKPEKDNNGFIVGAGNKNFKDQKLFEVSARKLINALEWFDLDMPELNELMKSSKYKTLNANATKQHTRYYITDENNAIVKSTINNYK